MTKFQILSTGFVIVLSLAGCDRAAAPADNAKPAAQSATADAETVKQAFATFNSAIVARDLPKIRAQYADDAVMILPDQKPFEGIDAIMGDYQNYARDPAGKYAPGGETTYVSSGGDLAYGQVTYDTTFTNPKTKAVETSTRYNIVVYKKQADGSWKVIRDINTALPKAG